MAGLKTNTHVKFPTLQHEKKEKKKREQERLLIPFSFNNTAPDLSLAFSIQIQRFHVFGISGLKNNLNTDKRKLLSLRREKNLEERDTREVEDEKSYPQFYSGQKRKNNINGNCRLRFCTRQGNGILICERHMYGSDLHVYDFKRLCTELTLQMNLFLDIYPVIPGFWRQLITEARYLQRHIVIKRTVRKLSKLSYNSRVVDSVWISFMQKLSDVKKKFDEIIYFEVLRPFTNY
ncbi:CLUMA_CG008757, isoform A [Clunio marinus]|uniref:CLUMA_CG008757, isoform A n=1 Tax=Clunio marinus TaxID=568069 RepID=A0A1J1I9R0_9DIPT|nr:CLUMA_CG008757, isoform A [Clunio marinus]